MKKLLLSLLASILITTGMSLPAFCDDKYVPSIGLRDDVKLASDPIYEDEDLGTLELILTPYVREKEITSQESVEEMEEAYEMILNVSDVSQLNEEEIIDVSHMMGVETEDLVVRDLFDVTLYYEGLQVIVDDTDTPKFQFSIQAQTLENYVCLLVYHDGKWKVVKDTEVLKDQNLINVLTDELSPFALVVATDYRYVAPAHGNGCIWHLFIIITMIITFVLTQIIRRKSSESYDKRRRLVLLRDIISIISVILCIIFYILGTCKYDVYALIIELLIVCITFIYSHTHKHEQ